MLRGSLRERALDESLNEGRRDRNAQPVDHHAVDANQPSVGVDERATRVTRCESHVSNDPARRLGSIARDRVQDAHRERIANAKWMPVRENQLTGAERLGVS